MTEPSPRFTTPLGSDFVLIEPGKFIMGSTSSDATTSEEPVREVEINDPFFISTRPVTQIEWTALMGNNPSKFSDGFESGLRPVESVSWIDAMNFIEILNSEDANNYLGLSGRFRLPSEAEWEYATRAGTTTSWSHNDSERVLSEYCWHAGNSGAKTHLVGQKRSNPWGLFDVHGLVSEWCLDAWHTNYLDAPNDQRPWLENGEFDYRVHRGGCWFHESHSCRSSSRGRATSQKISDGLGFRLVWEPLGE